MVTLIKTACFATLVLCLGVNAAGREPSVAGTFYPGDRAELASAVDRYLVPTKGAKAPGKVVAVLAPHAGYEYSGKLAGMAYWHIEAAYDTVVVLATGHTEGVKGAALLASDAYKTPLGRVEPDRELAAALVRSSSLFEDRPSAHLREHAVEVQLPFLQRKIKKPFKVLGATLNTGDLEAARAVGASLAAALKGKKALIVISADFSHYPSRPDAAASDGAMRLAMEGMDPELVWNTARFIEQKKIPGLDTCACGQAAIAAGMEAARLLGAGSFLTLKVSESYSENPSGRPERVVGYISGLFLKGGKPRDLVLSGRQRGVLLKEARLTLERHFDGAARPSGLDADPRLNLPGAAFVTLTKDGKLRGCVGTVTPGMTLIDAVRYGAYSAAFRDDRFRPVDKAELAGLKLEVSVLSPLAPAKPGQIKPRVHGVVVVKDGKSGLFLPQVWDQIPGKEDFMGELCEQKAGLPRGCWKQAGTKLYSFTVDSFEEGDGKGAKSEREAE